MTVDEAIQSAMDAVKRHFQGSGHLLEEVQVGDDGGYEVTVSYHPPDLEEGERGHYLAGLGGRRAAIGVDPNRVYKVVAFGRTAI